MSVLVLVHGFMGGSAQWADQQKALVSRFDIVAVDLPGFGLNHAFEAPDRIGGYAEFVLDILSKRGIDRFRLLGHSMGGMIAQEMTAIAPERIDQLVLYGTGATGILPGRFETIEESKRRALNDGARATARRISATWFLEREEASGYEACATIAENSSLQAIIAGLDAIENWSRVENLAHIRCPNLIICGDRDRTYSWAQTERLWKTIPNSNLAIVPGCAHAAHLEKPGIFNSLIEDFFE